MQSKATERDLRDLFHRLLRAGQPEAAAGVYMAAGELRLSRNAWRITPVALRAAEGARAALNTPAQSRHDCRNCGGDGFTHDAPVCPACDGRGWVERVVESPYVDRACLVCAGTDRILAEWSYAGATYEGLCITCRRRIAGGDSDADARAKLMRAYVRADQ